MPAESQMEAPAFLKPQNVRKPVKVPTMPMDIVFAPRVVNPPCPMKVWKSKAIAEITTVGKGPIIMAAIAVPVGWEQDPVRDRYVPNGNHENSRTQQADDGHVGGVDFSFG